MCPMKNSDRTLLAFGRNVARIRAGRGFSQDKLAEKADLDRTFVSGIERGVRIARALEVSIGELFKGVNA